jgi:hypothetical protein
MSYGPNNAVMFRRAGAFVDKILKDTKGLAIFPSSSQPRSSC